MPGSTLLEIFRSDDDNPDIPVCALQENPMSSRYVVRVINVPCIARRYMVYDRQTKSKSYAVFDTKAYQDALDVACWDTQGRLFRHRDFAEAAAAELNARLEAKLNA